MPLRGYVPTPEALVDQMVNLLFEGCPPKPGDRLLDAGCGPGAFISGVIRWSERNGRPMPSITGVELDPRRADAARTEFGDRADVTIHQRDFLREDLAPSYDFVISNPPYVSILGMDSEEKAYFRGAFQSAVGRFDLYMLFLEHALDLAKPEAQVVFVTPEKFMYVASGAGLRRVLGSHHVTDLLMIKESVFTGVTAYPAVTKVVKDRAGATRLTLRSGASRIATLPGDGTSWRQYLTVAAPIAELDDTAHTLDHFCRRISCGIATGADGLFVMPTDRLPERLLPFAWPTVSGRQLIPDSDAISTSSVMLVPYGHDSKLRKLEELEAFAEYLKQPSVRKRLRSRTCAKHKPWHAFHDGPPMTDLTQAKILCKDICEAPSFWLDCTGAVIPRHTVYYIVPKRSELLESIAAFLNSPPARRWLMQNAQRAAKGFFRIQSSLLKKLPVPDPIAREWATLPPSAPPRLPLPPSPVVGTSQ